MKGRKTNAEGKTREIEERNSRDFAKRTLADRLHHAIIILSTMIIRKGHISARNVSGDDEKATERQRAREEKRGFARILMGVSQLFSRTRSSERGSEECIWQTEEKKAITSEGAEK
jgi:hypothetical protein